MPVTEKVVPLTGESVEALKQKKNFIRELKEEIRKVSWTSKEELTKSTKIVLGATFAFGIAIYLVDLLVRSSLAGLDSLVHRIVG